jgi:cytochrome P450
MTIWNPTDDGHADLSSHDSFVHGAPHNTFRRLRDHDPLAWCDYPGGQGFWSVTRHQDILDLNRNHAVFSSAHGIRMEDQTDEEVLARRTFQETDPPEHTRTRLLVAKAFSKPMVAQFEAQIRALCVDILDQALAAGDAIDAIPQIARQLPMRMLGRIVGLPEEDLEWLVDKGDALMANTDSDFTAHVLDQTDTEAYRLMPFRSPAGAELYAYARQLMARKRSSGDTSGVLHLITQPDAQGQVISDTEFCNFFCLLVAAGNDTTRYSIAAALHALAVQPGLLEQLAQGDAALWDGAPDEFIRWASPAMYFRRTALQDVELHGKTIRAGDKLLLWFVSGNRDERAWDQPFTVRLDRGVNRHLSFGQGGPHVCLGMWLARLEVRVLLQELVRRVSRIEQTAPHAFLRSNFVGGIKRLPVRLHRRA